MPETFLPVSLEVARVSGIMGKIHLFLARVICSYFNYRLVFLRLGSGNNKISTAQHILYEENFFIRQSE